MSEETLVKNKTNFNWFETNSNEHYSFRKSFPHQNIVRNIDLFSCLVLGPWLESKSSEKVPAEHTTNSYIKYVGKSITQTEMKKTPRS